MDRFANVPDVTIQILTDAQQDRKGNLFILIKLAHGTRRKLGFLPKTASGSLVQSALPIISCSLSSSLHLTQPFIVTLILLYIESSTNTIHPSENSNKFQVLGLLHNNKSLRNAQAKIVRDASSFRAGIMRKCKNRVQGRSHIHLCLRRKKCHRHTGSRFSRSPLHRRNRMRKLP